jgi:hypothetical protein
MKSMDEIDAGAPQPQNLQALTAANCEYALSTDSLNCQATGFGRNFAAIAMLAHHLDSQN